MHSYKRVKELISQREELVELIDDYDNGLNMRIVSESESEWIMNGITPCCDIMDDIQALLIDEIRDLDIEIEDLVEDIYYNREGVSR